MCPESRQSLSRRCLLRCASRHILQPHWLLRNGPFAMKEGLLKFSEAVPQITGKGWKGKSWPYDRFHCLIFIWFGGEPPKLPCCVKLHWLITQGTNLNVPLEVGAQRSLRAIISIAVLATFTLMGSTLCPQSTWSLYLLTGPDFGAKKQMIYRQEMGIWKNAEE